MVDGLDVFRRDTCHPEYPVSQPGERYCRDLDLPGNRLQACADLSWINGNGHPDSFALEAYNKESYLFIIRKRRIQ
jgi:hypothetical protein